MRGYTDLFNYNSIFAAAYIAGSVAVVSAAILVGAAKKLWSQTNL